jgi:hypothetical protein
MVERPRVATREELGKLGHAYNETRRHLPYGGVPKGRLPTEPDRRTVPSARNIASEAAQLVQFRIPEIEPQVGSFVRLRLDQHQRHLADG